MDISKGSAFLEVVLELMQDFNPSTREPVIVMHLVIFSSNHHSSAISWNIFIRFDKKCINKEEKLMKAAVPAESYVIHLSSASLFSCDVYGQ